MLPGLSTPMAGFADAVIEVILGASSTGVSIQTLFSAPEWSSATKKRVVVPAGVTRGSTNPATYVLSTGTGRGGALEIVVDGTLEGAGAAATTGAGAVGGGVLNVQQSGVTLRGSGAMKAGGGSGGKGGAGSANVVEGPFWAGHPVYYAWAFIDGSQRNIYWAATSGPTYIIYTGAGAYSAPDGWYYYPVSYVDYGSWYSIARSQTQATTGGNGGRGQGHSLTQQAGSAGGTNAGTGGTGGTFGNAGADGAAGNAGSGLSGGLAGIVINGNSNLTDLFSGTKLGRTV
jgi:hypothetical protein